MNLPDTAIEFLDAFRGLYGPLRKLEGASEAIDAAGEDCLPMVHCYCFTKEVDGAEKDILEVSRAAIFFFFPCRQLADHRRTFHLPLRQRASLALGFSITPASKDYKLRFVRDVAPKKEMYCLEFRLSKEMLE